MKITRQDAEQHTEMSPSQRAAAAIAEADEKIRRARAEADAARRAVGQVNRFLADVFVDWLDEGGVWRPAFSGKLSIPYPTLASVGTLVHLLLISFRPVSREHEIRAGAVTFPPGEDARSVLAYDYADPNGRR